MVAKRSVLKSQLPLIIVAATALVLAIIYFVSQRPGHSKCDGIFEQTTDRLRANLDFINIKGGLDLGREKVQELTEGSQKVALHLKTCCIAQQAGNMNADRFQVCISGAKDYETRIVEVATNIKEAKAAEEQQKPDLARQKMKQAREAASEAINTEKTLAKTTESLAATVTPKSTLQHLSTPTTAVKFEKSAVPAIAVEKFESSPDAFDQFNIVQAGTDLSGTYRVKYQPNRVAPLLSNRATMTSWRQQKAEEHSFWPETSKSKKELRLESILIRSSVALSSIRSPEKNFPKSRNSLSSNRERADAV